MANSYFRFKQFTVHQEHCAMKVCTDACLFGAWVAEKINDEKFSNKNVLDIGTGTGLLSLMLAQKLTTHVDAVEADIDACEQAKSNFINSPWKHNLAAHCADINEFTFLHDYDIIISNPPFFEASLQSEDSKKNAAKHTVNLTFEELASIVAEHLSRNGKFYVLLSHSSFLLFEEIATGLQLYSDEILQVKQTPQHSFFRTIGSFCLEKKEVITRTLSIKQEDGTYSNEFTALLKDYYLYL